MRIVAPAAAVLLLLLTAACGSEPVVAPTPIEDEAPQPPATPQEPAEDPAGQDPPAGGETQPDDPPAEEPPPQQPPEPPEPPPPPPPPPPAPPVVLVGAGDIGLCGHEGAHRTAALLDTIDGIVFTAGDHAYPHGRPEDFANCYEPTWGRHKSRTRPSPGNHDYETPGASGYFAYFGSNAGPAGLGYYSFMAGSWLVLSLNSNVPADAGSAQLAWVRQQLQTHEVQCTAAIWHHAVRSSGEHGDTPHMREVWRTLHEWGADLVISAHNHVYERFAPLDAEARPAASGMRQFIVGTGGGDHDVPGPRSAGSEVLGLAWGVMKLTLFDDRYEWEFVPAAGETFRDFGGDRCR